MRAISLLTLLVTFVLPAHPAWAGGFPNRIAPGVPFPLVLSESFEQEAIAPGITFGRYYLMTTTGPLVIHALCIDLREPTVHVDTVLADDRLISKGEALSSMAQRTGAVAGINADYFDIGNTYQPIGILVQGGTLVRSPSGRAVLTITKDRAARFETVAFGGTVRDRHRRVWRLSSLNMWPPYDGVSFLSPALGTIPAEPGDMLVQLTPLGRNRFRAASIVDTNVPHAPLSGPALAFGVFAMSENGVPNQGDILDISFDTDPPLAEIAAAIGGGPQLIRNGADYRDPAPPAAQDALRLEPLSGALRQRDGTFMLVQADGRAPRVSTGLTRPEFTALLRALGAVDGMAFDGGGSSTIVARLPGDRSATVQNMPSDGHERPVTDGVFVFSSAGIGPPARLTIRHGKIRILRGATTSIEAVITDAGGHVLDLPREPIRASIRPASLAHIGAHGRLIAGNIVGEGVVRLERNALAADVPLEILDHVDTLRIEPAYPNPQAGERIVLHARAFNRAGAPIDIDGRITWAAPGTSIGADGNYRTQMRDGMVIVNVAGKQARTTVRVGQRDLPIDAFRHNGLAPRKWHFMTTPPGGPGSVEIDDDDVLALSYDFTTGHNIASADTSVALDGALLGVRMDVLGDGSAVTLRAAVTTTDGDRIPFTLARRIDWQGWRTLTIPLPRAALAPRTLDALYLVAPRQSMLTLRQTSAASGTIAFRNLHGIFAGTSALIPPYHFQ